MGRKLIVALFAATIMLTSAVLGGCQPARKPIPPKPQITQDPSTKPQSPAPAKQQAPQKQTTGEQKMADNAARESVKVSGVQSASVVISGSTAYIGLGLKPNTEKDRTTLISKDVAERVKAANTKLKQVYVTSDPDLVTRIKKIADGIKKGQPVSSFANELTEINRRIKPQAS